MAKPKHHVAPIPQGLKVKVTADLPVAWDFEKRQVLDGTVQAIQIVELAGKEGVRVAKVAHVANKDGTFGLWESATLKPLFRELKEGDHVWVRYEGRGEKKPGQDAPKLFTAGVVE